MLEAEQVIAPPKEDLEGQESPSKHLPAEDVDSSEEEAEELDQEDDIESARNQLSPPKAK